MTISFTFYGVILLSELLNILTNLNVDALNPRFCLDLKKVEIRYFGLNIDMNETLYLTCCCHKIFSILVIKQFSYHRVDIMDISYYLRSRTVA